MNFPERAPQKVEWREAEEQLEGLWVACEPASDDLVARSLQRLRKASPRARVVPAPFTQRVAAIVGMAAALVLMLALHWLPEPGVSPLPAWADGLELPDPVQLLEPSEELEYRLREVHGLLAELDALAGMEDPQQLRERMDRLQDEMEVF